MRGARSKGCRGLGGPVTTPTIEHTNDCGNSNGAATIVAAALARPCVCIAAIVAATIATTTKPAARGAGLDKTHCDRGRRAG